MKKGHYFGRNIQSYSDIDGDIDIKAPQPSIDPGLTWLHELHFVVAGGA